MIGVAVLGLPGCLLMRLAASTRSLGGDSMVLLRSRVVAAGGLAAFSTMFYPAAARAPSHSPASSSGSAPPGVPG